LRERNFASGVFCDAITPGRAPAEAKAEKAVVLFLKPVEKHGSFGFAVRALVRPGSDP